MTKSGVLTLGASLASWALLLVTSRAVLTLTGLEPWIFTLIQMMVAGVFLLVVTGGFGGQKSALRDPYIWLYGVLRVATAALFTAALLHTSAANAAFLGVVSVPMSVLLLWLSVGRQTGCRELPGHGVILLGLVLLAQSLEGGWANPAITLMILSEICVVLSTVIAEFHPMNQGDSVRQRAQLTGIMLLASACVMLSALGGLVALARWLPGAEQLLPQSLGLIDTPLALLDAQLWIAACAVGVLLRGPSLYLALAAIRAVKTENYLAGMAALPFLSLGFETLAYLAGILPPVTSAGQSLLFGLIIASGSLLVLFARSRRPTNG